MKMMILSTHCSVSANLVGDKSRQQKWAVTNLSRWPLQSWREWEKKTFVCFSKADGFYSGKETDPRFGRRCAHLTRPPACNASRFGWLFAAPELTTQVCAGSAGFGQLSASAGDTPALQAAVDAGVALKVLVIGGGGREHAICHGLQRSSSCNAVFCAPGNPGIAAAGDAICVPDLDISTSSRVIGFCSENDVTLVVVGPEAPLVAGLVDDLQAAGIVGFGPSAKAAALEGSKNFMKKLCIKYDIPTAKYKSFTTAKDAKEYIKEMGTPIVVKADGLAAGKGVIIATTLEEAFDAVDSMLVDKAFGAAGGLVIVEEFLDGEEVSFFALVDGEHAVPMASAQDHKRVGDGDTGPNTGGMGAYSPAPIVTPQLEALVMDSIIHPTVKGMEEEGCKFVGVLYAGLIIDKKSGKPKLLEYNVRFGDPECQVLIPRLQSDLARALLAACKGELRSLSLSWSDEAALVVVLASNGYPGKYKKGTLIKNLEKAEASAPGVKVFHAGTSLDSNGNFVASGGRVLGLMALGKDIVQAQERAYQAVDRVDWPGGFCRRDIGWRAVAHLQECHKGRA